MGIACSFSSLTKVVETLNGDLGAAWGEGEEKQAGI